MNIFYLDTNPKIVSIYLCDRHCVKMILESAQMLCTAHRILGTDSVSDYLGLYKSTHKNHPCSVWTRASSNNYKWHFKLFTAMLDEYKFRYKRIHACTKLMSPLSEHPYKIPCLNFTAPPQCMPDEYKCNDTVKAYRNYYKYGKSHIAEWKFRNRPLFMEE